MSQDPNNFITTGTILEKHGGDVYKVKLQNNQIILCWMTARFRVSNPKGRGKRRPKVVVGDQVQVEISPKDFNKGMLVGFA